MLVASILGPFLAPAEYEAEVKMLTITHVCGVAAACGLGAFPPSLSSSAARAEALRSSQQYID